MKEKGINISKQRSRGFNELHYKGFDYMITMGCSDVCPFVPAKQRIEWEFDDPKEESVEKFREVRDKIEKKIKEFMKEIGV